MGRIWTWLTDPGIGERLLRDEGEVIVEVVHKHWVVYIIPALLAFAGVLCWVVVPFIDVSLGWAPLLVGAVLILWGAGRALDRKIDQFVITNMRVFRIHGLLSRSQATMPLRRILDITVVQPLLGRMLGYGNLTFESAAQDQGLRDIRHVSHPTQRDLVIQRLVQRSGLRGPKVPN
jgi:uncharacterized membrane protein YdbT with pleckstrin-like domain